MKGTKDTLNARVDLKVLSLKKKFWVKDGEKDIPDAPFVISKTEKLRIFNYLKTLWVPSGFSSNFANGVNLGTLPFAFKSHDYHMIMQHLLLMLLMHAYPVDEKPLFRYIQKISIFFNVLCAKVISREHLKKAKQALTESLCVLETYFPPSFFVIMIHLMRHLGDEALAARPLRFRSMWTFEREMKRYKKWTRNKCHIEGSIVEAYMLHKASFYVMEYISLMGKGTHKRNREAFFDDEDQENLEQHVGKVEKTVLNTTQFVQVRKWVLQQQHDYEEWKRKYDVTGRHTPASTWKYAVDDFIIWLGEEANITNDLKMKSIVVGPDNNVDS